MSSALRNTEPYGFSVIQQGGGRVDCVSEGSTVIRVDQSQRRPVPAGAALLDDFLSRFMQRAEIAPHLPSARAEFAKELAEVGELANLRTLRLSRGLSQSEFAAAMGTSQAAVSAYESRSRKPNEDSLRAMAKVLDVDFNTLMEALANG